MGYSTVGSDLHSILPDFLPTPRHGFTFEPAS
jgi:hypothetical protein